MDPMLHENGPGGNRKMDDQFNGFAASPTPYSKKTFAGGLVSDHAIRIMHALRQHAKKPASRQQARETRPGG